MIMLDDIDYCETCQHCEIEPHLEPCVSCKTKYIGTPTKYLAKRHTNADRIRAMSDEELAKEFADCAIGLYCDTRKKGIPELPESVKREVFDSLLEWFKQPAEGGKG
jgi:hypothetical protein